MDEGTKRALQGGAIAVVALTGLFWAAGAEGERGYTLGLLMFAVAAVLQFRLIDAYFTARSGGARRLLPNPAALIPGSRRGRGLAGAGGAALALAALSTASTIPAARFAHEAALAVFIGAVVYIFVLIKADFDRRGHA